MINLIGLVGPSRAGKDETAAVLVKDFGFEQRAQAAAIRKILLGLNAPVSDNDGNYWTMQKLFEFCDSDWDKVKAVSRESVDQMIALGQTCRTVLGIDIWLNTAIPSPMDLENGLKVVISDVRQPNEYHAIKERGGMIWKVTRPGVEYRAMDGLLDHLDMDAVIENRGTLADLRGIVAATISSKIHGEYVQRNEFLNPSWEPREITGI